MYFNACLNASNVFLIFACSAIVLFEDIDIWLCISSTNIIACRVSLLLILFTLFDDNGGASPTHKILSSCDLCPPQVLWIWWLVLMAEDYVVNYPLGKSPSLRAAGFRQQDTQIDFLLFPNCLRSFIPD